MTLTGAGSLTGLLAQPTGPDPSDRTGRGVCWLAQDHRPTPRTRSTPSRGAEPGATAWGLRPGSWLKAWGAALRAPTLIEGPGGGGRGNINSCSPDTSKGIPSGGRGGPRSHHTSRGSWDDRPVKGRTQPCSDPWGRCEYMGRGSFLLGQDTSSHPSHRVPSRRQLTMELADSGVGSPRRTNGELSPECPVQPAPLAFRGHIPHRIQVKARSRQVPLDPPAGATCPRGCCSLHSPLHPALCAGTG